MQWKCSGQFHRLRIISIKMLSIVFAIYLFFGSADFIPAKAAESDSADSGPHLIQTVTEQDLYDGLLALGFLECPVLKEDDLEAAYENARKCVVGIHMGNASGSGIILHMTPERIIIVTNKHVLDYWENETDYVQFYQGYVAEARLAGVSGQYDVGFLIVDNGQLGYQARQSLCYARCNQDAYQKLRIQDEVFCIGGELEGERYYPGRVETLWIYIEELEGYMMQTDGMAIPGMSGGGTFDARGNLVGMITGGSRNGKTASIPLSVLLDAYEEVTGNASENI